MPMTGPIALTVTKESYRQKRRMYSVCVCVCVGGVWKPTGGKGKLSSEAQKSHLTGLVRVMNYEAIHKQPSLTRTQD